MQQEQIRRLAYTLWMFGFSTKQRRYSKWWRLEFFLAQTACRNLLSEIDILSVWWPHKEVHRELLSIGFRSEIADGVHARKSQEVQHLYYDKFSGVQEKHDVGK